MANAQLLLKACAPTGSAAAGRSADRRNMDAVCVASLVKHAAPRVRGPDSKDAYAKVCVSLLDSTLKDDSAWVRVARVVVVVAATPAVDDSRPTPRDECSRRLFWGAEFVLWYCGIILLPCSRASGLSPVYRMWLGLRVLFPSFAGTPQLGWALCHVGF